MVLFSIRDLFWLVLLPVFCVYLIPGNTSTIYIYNDSGTGPQSVRPCVDFFNQVVPSFKVESIQAKQVIDGAWHEDGALFVMPGGAAKQVGEKLNGPGNDQIRAFVEKGGSYLGICAGAYYASKTTLFDIDGPYEVHNEKELQLFKGQAIGPVLKNFSYTDSRGAGIFSMAFAHSDFQKFERLPLVLNGGCYFQGVPKECVVATYQESVDASNLNLPKDAPALICLSYGLGQALLSGVHFEYNPDKFLENYLSPQDIKTLKIYNAHRLEFGAELLKKLGVSKTLGEE